MDEIEVENEMNTLQIEIICKISGRNCDGSRKNCCTDILPCDVGEGNCNSDVKCKGTLICGKNNCIGNNFGANDNCCTEPTIEEDVPYFAYQRA